MYYGERLNTYTHLVGSALAIAGLSILATLAVQQHDWLKLASFCVYGGSLVLLYGCSTVYHAVRERRVKAILQKLDHNAIYLLIAGSYTPIALITLRGAWGWTLFGINWGLAVLGVAQESLRGQGTRRLSMLLYVLMGWLVLVAIRPLSQALSLNGLLWLVAGGVVYSAGIYFYLRDDKVAHFHGVWHLFVLGGSICHFLCMLFYVA